MSTSFEQRLQRESVAWVAEGLIGESQRSALLARHPAGAAGGGRFVAILGMVGGGLLLAGVCLLISANWQEIGDWAKIGGLVGLLVGAYVAGWWCKVSPGRMPKTGDVFFMVGAGLFMAGIALVSQTFHLNARPAAGVLTWWLGIVAVPWLVRSKGAQGVSIVAGLVWLGTEAATKGSWLELAHGLHGDDEFFLFVALYALAGMALWLGGLALRRGRWAEFAGVHETGGVLLTCVALYALGFVRHGWRWLGDGGMAGWPVVTMVGMVVLAAGAMAWRGGGREVRMLAPWLVLACVPVGAVLAGWRLGDGGWLWSALAWGGLFVLNLFMVRAGLATGRESWVNIAVGFVVLNIVTRYFDLFGTMLEGGVFFVVSGLLVLVAGIAMERQRRRWLATIRNHQTEVLS